MGLKQLFPAVLMAIYSAVADRHSAPFCWGQSVAFTQETTVSPPARKGGTCHGFPFIKLIFFPDFKMNTDFLKKESEKIVDKEKNRNYIAASLLLISDQKEKNTYTFGYAVYI